MTVDAIEGTAKPNNPQSDYSVDRRWNGLDVNIKSIDLARRLLQKSDLHRFGPLAALLNSALRHRVMIVAEGADWQKTHDALMPSFLPTLVEVDYEPIVRAVADEEFTKLASGRLGVDAVEIAIEPAMRVVLARVLGHVVFGRAMSAEDAARLALRLDAVTQVIDRGLAAHVNRTLAAIFRSCRLSGRQPMMIPKAQRGAIEELIAWIDMEAQQVRASSRPSPLLDRLAARFEYLSEAKKRRAIAAECAMIFIAGIETTAAALTFAVAELVDQPDLLNRATQEARRPAPQTIPRVAEQFPLIHRVILETLRRHTIVPTILREASDHCKVGLKGQDGFPEQTIAIERHTTIRFLSLPGHLRRGVWDKPMTFDPDRFRGPLTAAQKKAYLPFGLGPQSCIGRTMALMESVLVLASLLRQLDLESGSNPKPVRVRRNALFTNRPTGVTVRAISARPG